MTKPILKVIWLVMKIFISSEYYIQWRNKWENELTDSPGQSVYQIWNAKFTHYKHVGDIPKTCTLPNNTPVLRRRTKRH